MNHRDLLRQVLPWLRAQRNRMECDRIVSSVAADDLPITPGEELLLAVVADVEKAIGSGDEATRKDAWPTPSGDGRAGAPGATINAGTADEIHEAKTGGGR